MPRKRLTRDGRDAGGHTEDSGRLVPGPSLRTGEIGRNDRRGTGQIWTRRCLTLLAGTGAR
jgi:hypothetical protein